MKKEYEKSTNFLHLYEHHCGNSQVPEIYHRWCAISLLAACLGNNVWIEKLNPGDRLYPNLYVLLVGPSASGKGVAINKAARYAELVPQIINPVHVSTTKRGSIQIMNQEKRYPDEYYWGSRIYMITSELVNDIGSGPLADDWVRWMTKMYTETNNPQITDSTGIHGVQTLEYPMINWLGGSTEEWMRKSISEDAITGGFFGRTVVVPGEVNYDDRVYRPTVPWDYQDVKEYLSRRIEAYCRLTGQMVLSPEAAHIDSQWYMTRPPPQEESEEAIWNREHDMILKVAMIVAISDISVWGKDHYDLVIKRDHLIAAQKWVREVYDGVKGLIKITSNNRESVFFEVVMKHIKNSRNGIGHSQLLRKVCSRGITSKYLASIMLTLIEAGHVHVEARGLRGAQFYVWKRKRLG